MVCLVAVEFYVVLALILCGGVVLQECCVCLALNLLNLFDTEDWKHDIDYKQNADGEILY